MELSLILRRLWRLRLLVAVGLLVAAVAGASMAYDVTPGEGFLEPRGTALGAAQTIVYVDTTRPSLVTAPSDYAQLTSRAQVLARLVGSGRVRTQAARRLGTEARDITVEGPLSDAPGQQNVQPAAQERANAILGEDGEFSVFIDTEPNVPTITLFIQADTGADAVDMGDALVAGLRGYVRELARATRDEQLDRVRAAIASLESTGERTLTPAERRQQAREVLEQGTVIRGVGRPVGGDVRDDSSRVMVVLVFLAVLAAWCVLLVVASALVAPARRRS